MPWDVDRGGEDDDGFDGFESALEHSGPFETDADRSDGERSRTSEASAGRPAPEPAAQAGNGCLASTLETYVVLIHNGVLDARAFVTRALEL